MRKHSLLYYRTIEQIKSYQATPVHERLRWLEEASKFFYKILHKKSLVVREKFRKGEIK